MQMRFWLGIEGSRENLMRVVLHIHIYAYLHPPLHPRAPTPHEGWWYCNLLVFIEIWNSFPSLNIITKLKWSTAHQVVKKVAQPEFTRGNYLAKLLTGDLVSPALVQSWRDNVLCGGTPSRAGQGLGEVPSAARETFTTVNYSSPYLSPYPVLSSPSIHPNCCSSAACGNTNTVPWLAILCVQKKCHIRSLTGDWIS